LPSLLPSYFDPSSEIYALLLKIFLASFKQQSISLGLAEDLILNSK